MTRKVTRTTKAKSTNFITTFIFCRHWKRFYVKITINVFIEPMSFLISYIKFISCRFIRHSNIQVAICFEMRISLLNPPSDFNSILMLEPTYSTHINWYHIIIAYYSFLISTKNNSFMGPRINWGFFVQDYTLMRRKSDAEPKNNF